MKKIYILLASLFLFVFTGCDAILDAAYPTDYNESNPYDFTVDGLPYELNRYFDYENTYYPVIIPDGEDVMISSIEFKIYDYYWNPVGYWTYSGYSTDFVNNTYYNFVPLSYENDSTYSTQYNDYVDYFKFSLNDLEEDLRYAYWDWNDYLEIEILVTYYDGTQVTQEHTIGLY